MGNNDAGPPQNYFALGTLFTSYWKILNCFFVVQVTNTNALSDNERAPYLDVNALVVMAFGVCCLGYESYILLCNSLCP